MNYYQETKDKVLKSVDSSREGLSQAEAGKRLEEHGYNEISRKEKRSIFSLFIESFKDPMVIVLLIVAIVQVAIGEWIESLIIFVVLILNAILSVVQTKKAEDSLESLEKMSAPTADVYRDGQQKEIASKNLAVGDIVILESGDNIPADGRLIEAESLQVEEGALTGESLPSDKSVGPLDGETPLGDRVNMVYSSTMVTAGRGVMVVTSTGEKTEMGKVAELVQNASAKQTPLQRKLAQFSKKLGIAILLLSVLIFGTGSFTAIIGPNGCGKSTLLRAFARVLNPVSGRVLLDGRAIASYKSKEVARQLGLLPQTSLSPDGIRVADLVARGRAPYQNLIEQWRESDEAAVARALTATRLTELSSRLVDELSGGQRQRVWVAMLLAQDTPIMLLDEPTTFLDIAHQYELMELFRGFHDDGKTLVAVLHDLNQAARYADHLIVMKHGQVVTTGSPER